MTDRELLREYVERRSARAFEELVRRHVDWVHSAALRQVRDRHLAEDVTQATFIVLARKAAGLRERTMVSGWLFNVVRFVAARAHRSEVRRRHHELRAAELAAARGGGMSGGQDEPGWDELAAALDELVGRLGRRDRDALLIRFYEKKSYAEIGSQLAISEEAARKRVERAVGKLREMFGREGVVASAVGLEGALLTNASAPAGAGVVASAVAAAAGTGDAAALAEGAITMMTLKKVAVPAACLAVLLLAAAWAVWPHVAGPPAVRTVGPNDEPAPVMAPVAAPAGTPAAQAAAPRLGRTSFSEQDPSTDPAIRAAAEGAVVLPLATATKINKRDPDVVMHGVIAGRTWEEFGFLKFDLSALRAAPKKASFHAACFMVENTRGVQTPARLVFYAVKTDWDDTATHNFSSSSRQRRWAEGAFNPLSPLEIEQTPVATVEMPNPPPPGYNVSFDVTELVGDWVAGRRPNQGLMMRVDQAPGYSYQANLASFDYRKSEQPKIVCVPAE